MRPAKIDMPSDVSAYLFEAKGIQRYLLVNGKLRDVVGASDLVNNIASSDKSDRIGAIISDVRVGGIPLSVSPHVDSNSPDHEISFSRRTGGTFCIHGKRDVLVEIRRRFRLAIARQLPGLEFTDAIASSDVSSRADPVSGVAAGLNADMQSVQNAFAILGGARSNAAAGILPLGRPVLRIAPRSGLPAVSGYDLDDPIDRITVVHRVRADEMASSGAGLDGVAARFHPSGHEGVRYPRNLDDQDEDLIGNPLLPWRNDNDRRIALVHADISGLGQLYAGAGCATASQSLALARDIEDILVTAVRQANVETILPYVTAHKSDRFSVAPARPLVIGGDDVTILVRADLALPFTARLLALIEEMSERLQSDHPALRLPRALTACAGVAISRAGLPFLTMNALAESLCSFAKIKAKAVPRSVEEADRPYPSLFAFHVQTQTAEENYERDIHPAYAGFTGNPYRIGAYASDLTQFPDWDEAMSLAAEVDALRGAFGSLRRIRSLLANGRETEAAEVWHRMFTRTDRDAAAGDQLRERLSAIAGTPVEKHAIPAAGAARGGLFDALELIDLGMFDQTRADEAAREAAA